MSSGEWVAPVLFGLGWRGCARAVGAPASRLAFVRPSLSCDASFAPGVAVEVGAKTSIVAKGLVPALLRNCYCEGELVRPRCLLSVVCRRSGLRFGMGLWEYFPTKYGDGIFISALLR